MSRSKEKIRSMFDSIAPGYDSLNHILSLGFDRGWRRRALKEILQEGNGEAETGGAYRAADAGLEAKGTTHRGATQQGTTGTARHATTQDGSFRILDLACGTGDFSIAIARALRRQRTGLAPAPAGTKVPDFVPGTTGTDPAATKPNPAAPPVTGLDISEGMLAVMRHKVSRMGLQELIECSCGDGTALPFPDGSFDRVTIGFGIRNFDDREQALREILRVLRPGGRLIILELSVPEIPVVRGLYRWYFTRILPAVGGLLSGDKAAYRYLPASVLAFPGKEEWMGTMRNAGFRRVSHKAFTLGICRMYVGEK